MLWNWIMKYNTHYHAPCKLDKDRANSTHRQRYDLSMGYQTQQMTMVFFSNHTTVLNSKRIFSILFCQSYLMPILTFQIGVMWRDNKINDSENNQRKCGNSVKWLWWWWWGVWVRLARPYHGCWTPKSTNVQYLVIKIPNKYLSTEI